MSNIYSKLKKIQQTLKVEKSQFNKFSGFYYRSKEDILESLKPLCDEEDLVIICNDEFHVATDNYIYIKTTATLIDCETGEKIEASGLAREQETKKGMDSSQITGTASSYAGKRALGNLFAIDDTADSDTPMNEVKKPPTDRDFVAHCLSCGSRYTFQAGTTIEALNATPCCPNPNYEVE